MSKTKQIWEDINFLINSADDDFIADVTKRAPDSVPIIISTLLKELRSYRSAEINIISSLDDDDFVELNKDEHQDNLFNSDF